MFAWFERALVPFARLFDEGLLELSALDYVTPRSKLFLRLSVMATDATLVLSLWLQKDGVVSSSTLRVQKDASGTSTSSSGSSSSRRATNVVSALVLLNAGLLIVDHIHFQYVGGYVGDTLDFACAQPLPLCPCRYLCLIPCPCPYH